MREWLLVLAPVALVTYFLIYPNEFRAFMGWFGRLLQ